MRISMRQQLITVKMSVTCLFLLTCGGAFPSDDPFYKGKMLTVIQGGTPGGSGDLRIRTVNKYLRQYLPGKPTILQKYLPGGGGIFATNHIVNSAKRDGLTVGVVGSSIYANAMLEARGARYRVKDLFFLGSPSPGGPYALLIRPGLALNTVEELRAHKGLRFAQRSIGHLLYIADRMFAFVLELREPKWVLGYASSELRLALERGEADARTTGTYSLIRTRPGWQKEGYTVPVLMKESTGRGVESFPGFPQDRPFLEKYADTKLKKAVLLFHKSIRPGSTIFFTSSRIPKIARKALRQAFNKTIEDPRFGAEYQRMLGEPVRTVTGEQIDQALAQIPTGPKIKEVYKMIITAGPLPPVR